MAGIHDAIVFHGQQPAECQVVLIDEEPDGQDSLRRQGAELLLVAAPFQQFERAAPPNHVRRRSQSLGGVAGRSSQGRSRPGERNRFVRGGCRCSCHPRLPAESLRIPPRTSPVGPDDPHSRAIRGGPVRMAWPCAGRVYRLPPMLVELAGQNRHALGHRLLRLVDRHVQACPREPEQTSSVARRVCIHCCSSYVE